MDRISSPEQLQDYMRVTSPGIWMVLLAVVVLLVGLIACSVAGRLETTIQVDAVSDNGVVTVTLSRDQQNKVKAGDELRVAGKEGTVDYVYQSESGAYIASADMDVPDGQHDAEIVIESIAPISFLLND